MTKSWFAVLNPKSGGGRAARDRINIVHILRRAGVQFELTASQHAGHAICLAREAATSGYRKFLAAGVGFDAHVVARMPNNRWGALSCLAALPASFASYRAPELTVSAEGQTRRGTVFVAFAALGRYCGGGMHIAPGATTDDGMFDVVIIGSIGKWELLLNVRRLFDGSISGYDKVRVLRTRSLEMAGPEPVGAQADGELLPPTPICLNVPPHSIRVVVP